MLRGGDINIKCSWLKSYDIGIKLLSSDIWLEL